MFQFIQYDDINNHRHVTVHTLTLFYARIFVISCIFVMVLGVGCKDNQQDKTKTIMPQRDINIVKEAHTSELMALPGVAGVYVGEMEDHTPCIVVMAVKKTPELDQHIPKTLEGHPVRIEETGEIKPMEEQ